MTLLSTADLIPKVRVKLGSNEWQTTHSNSVANVTTDTTVTVPDGTLWSKGAILEWQDNGEQGLVKSISTNDLTVKRQHNDTVAAAHSASSVIIRDPIFSYWEISKAITDAIAHSFPYMWKRDTKTITPVTNQSWYDFDVDAIDLIDAIQIYGTAPDLVIGYYVQSMYASVNPDVRNLPIVFVQNLPAATFASTKAVRFPGGIFDSTANIIVGFRQRLSGTTDLDDTGYIVDALVYDALGRILSTREVERNNIDDIPMGDASITPGSRLRVAAWYRQEAENLKRMAQFELMKSIPPMVTWDH